MNDLDVQLYDFALQNFETKKRTMFRELVRKKSRERLPKVESPSPPAPAFAK